MKKQLTLIAASLFLLCGGEDESGKCKDRGACNNCFKIYDSQGNYINGGSLSESSAYMQWDGKDCNGDSVHCGKYQVKYVVNGRQTEMDFVVSGPEAIHKDSRSECESLEKACTGFFYEEQTMIGPSCICCE